MSYVYWVWIGTFYLIFLTFKDHTNKMKIDDRHNWFMMGITFALITHFKQPFWYLLTLIVVTVLLNLYLEKRAVFGSADISSITWIFYGFGIIDLGVLIWFFIIFVAIMLIYGVAKYILAKYWLKFPTNIKTPFYIVILLSFILNTLLFRMHGLF